jgi:hypothetical protein
MKTNESDLMTASRWRFMSTQLAESLEEITQDRKITKKSVAPGVYAEAVRFFGSNGSIRDNALAIEIMKETREYDRRTEEEIKSGLERFAAFAQKLLAPRKLDHADYTTAVSMQGFMYQLRMRAENEDLANAAEDEHHFGRGRE